jgi:hypothetical protein
MFDQFDRDGDLFITRAEFDELAKRPPKGLLAPIRGLDGTGSARVQDQLEGIWIKVNKTNRGRIDITQLLEVFFPHLARVDITRAGTTLTQQPHPPNPRIALQLTYKFALVKKYAPSALPPITSLPTSPKKRLRVPSGSASEVRGGIFRLGGKSGKGYVHRGRGSESGQHFVIESRAAPPPRGGLERLTSKLKLARRDVQVA